MLISVAEGEEGADGCGEAETMSLTPCFCRCLAQTVPGMHVICTCLASGMLKPVTYSS